MALALLRSNDFAERVNQTSSEGDLRSLEIEILNYLETRPADVVKTMIALIACYIKLDDIKNAEVMLERCYSHVNGNVPFYLELFKAAIKNRKGNTKEAVEILRKLLKDNTLIERERISALVSLAVYNSNLSNYEEIHKVVLELWNMVCPNSKIDFDDNSFYSRVSQYTDEEPLIRVMSILESYLNGKELLKDQTYSDIYEYIKDYSNNNQDIDDVIPYEDIDIEFPDIKYFSLKIISKPMSIEEEFDLELYIYKLIISKYPGVLVLVNVIGNSRVSN
ncbi:tetratricopeptide repeat protein [Candidatus Magnetominusculus dajiuhuensis]|uniref:tetratricopeptide repeat protein n=1 Tax=Candidatus Magnetominusculus dajiuhuensis TaxID=3137712 RepID=UPI003B428DD3